MRRASGAVCGVVLVVLALGACAKTGTYDSSISGATSSTRSSTTTADPSSPAGTTAPDPGTGTVAPPPPGAPGTTAPPSVPVKKAKALAKADFIAAGDKICAAGAAAIAPKPASLTPAGIKTWVTAVVVANHKMFGDVAALGVPSTGSTDWKTIVTQQKNLYAQIEKDLPTLEKDPSKLVNDAAVTALRVTLKSSAEAFGFKVCGSTSP